MTISNLEKIKNYSNQIISQELKSNPKKKGDILLFQTAAYLSMFTGEPYTSVKKFLNDFRRKSSLINEDIADIFCKTINDLSEECSTESFSFPKKNFRTNYDTTHQKVTSLLSKTLGQFIKKPNSQYTIDIKENEEGDKYSTIPALALTRDGQKILTN